MNETGPDTLLRSLLPPVLEVMTAWDLAEGPDGAPGDPADFVAAVDRVIADVASAEEPRREMARLIFGQVSLAGILLDELARMRGTSRREVLQAVHREHVAPPLDG